VAHLARQRRKLANRRRTHLHQLTAAIAARFGGIAVEDLKVKTMTTSAKGTVERPGKNVRQKNSRRFAGHDDLDAALQG
jgi:putative transposase